MFYQKIIHVKNLCTLPYKILQGIPLRLCYPSHFFYNLSTVAKYIRQKRIPQKILKSQLIWKYHFFKQLGSKGSKDVLLRLRIQPRSASTPPPDLNIQLNFEIDTLISKLQFLKNVEVLKILNIFWIPGQYFQYRFVLCMRKCTKTKD